MKNLRIYPATLIILFISVTGDPPVAMSQVPRDGHPQAGGRDGRPVPGRPPALDRQLRPPLRLHLRLPSRLRHAALCDVRRVRAAP